MHARIFSSKYISTHAPLAGRDVVVAGIKIFRKDISTHAPLAGRDVHRVVVFPVRSISTHAPLAGRDPRQLL